MKIVEKLRVEPGRRIKLRHVAADATPGVKDKAEAVEDLAQMLPELRKLQYRLYAENRRSVLVVLQAMDAGGKDGVVRHVFSGLNPQGCRVTAFKAPSTSELDHDFLWRVHRAVPPYGEIGVFNRSHYEDVLIVRVHELVPKDVWRRRYAQINAFERYLAETGVTMLKFLLHISRGEQTRRLLDRVEDPERNWKLSPADAEERKYWDDYRRAYEDVLHECSTPDAPWYVIPSDHKWYRNWAIARVLLAHLRDMRLQFPEPLADPDSLRRLLRGGSAGGGPKKHGA
ncbi:MAG: polyphosphate kinase 2 family protein [Deltaproteobacteria bacterium]|nr:polyphosphate kinase 2 family protein [Deltaproteobacteria bacterium]